MTTTTSRTTLDEAFDHACDELDQLVGRVCRVDPVLHIYQTGSPISDTTIYVVTDRANQVTMLHTPKMGMALRFATAFVEKHPEAKLDDSFLAFSSEDLFSDLGEEPQADAPHIASVSQAGLAAEPASSPRITPEQAFALQATRLMELLSDPHSRRVPDNVVPIR